ncbi:hypothetical protein BDM02DRAFT_3273448 [Thelephora ganbajun]|uniref:Uncharacterized protein n=1 Tax=Thelephora ganbajun TaxID=370292 RepID=A0ACB6YYG0_THEGA|nr:hypothetical protein BDM02DRAFT_3273448 [Thelephora ganbajun]
MALVDFYQLAVIYNLRRRDADFPSNCSHPLSMSTDAPPTKPRVYSSLPPPTLPAPKTPQRRRGPATVVGLTPLSRGSSVRQRQEGDTDRVDRYDRGDYEEYVREDLNCRVFVDYEVFMKDVLHVPDDWRTEWGRAIEAVKADAKFNEHHERYCDLCEEAGTLEKHFYPPLMETANAVLDVVSRSYFKKIPPGKRQYYHVNDPNHLKGGVMNKNSLSPDLVLLHKNRPDPRTSRSRSLHWANPLHVLEVKPYDNALCDGKNMPRLVVDGVDPIQNHAAPPVKSRYRAKKPDPPTTPTPSSSLVASQSVSELTSASTSRKRPADGSSTVDPRAAKKSKANSVSPQAQGDEGCSPPGPETQHQVDPALQVCRYLLEMFSVPLLRSHATVSLVDRDRLQLYHANRSVILVSSAINFSDGDGKDKFIATIIAFHCLSLEKNGILETMVPKNAKLISKTKFGRNQIVQNQNELRFSGNAEVKPFNVTLADVISRDPAMVGRSTLVLNATSKRWPGVPLVIKISWPTSGRVSETDFLTKANAMAEGGHAWAANHLPRLYYTEDVVFPSDSTLGSVARLFEDAELVNGDYVYERRTLRIIIQERLYPLKSLTKVKDVGQVFVDAACVHHWLLEYPGILHRDFSFNNIMYRVIKEMNGDGEAEEKVYGVLSMTKPWGDTSIIPQSWHQSAT